MFILGNIRGVYIFKNGRFYEGSPEYVAVQEKNILYLCRMLLNSEYLSQFDEISFLLSDKDIKNGKTVGRPCIILQKLKSLDEADKLVSSYQNIAGNIKGVM